MTKLRRNPSSRRALLRTLTGTLTGTLAGTLTGTLLGVALSCGGAAAPEDVATTFWSSLRDGRIDEARAIALPIDAGRLEGLTEGTLITAVELGAIELGEDTARVETSLPSPQGDVVYRFPTHLTRVQGEWRVDAQKTLGSMREAVITASLEQAGEALRESGRIFGEALGKSARDASRAIEEALEEFSRSLEGPPPRAPADPPAPESPPAEQPGGRPL